MLGRTMEQLAGLGPSALCVALQQIGTTDIKEKKEQRK